METQKTEFDVSKFVGRPLDEAATTLTAAGYKIRVVPVGVPVMLTEDMNPGRATIEVANGLITHVRIG